MDLLLAIGEAVARGETEFDIHASGQHDIGGPPLERRRPHPALPCDQSRSARGLHGPRSHRNRGGRLRPRRRGLAQLRRAHHREGDAGDTARSLRGIGRHLHRRPRGHPFRLAHEATIRSTPSPNSGFSTAPAPSRANSWAAARWWSAASTPPEGASVLGERALRRHGGRRGVLPRQFRLLRRKRRGRARSRRGGHRLLSTV